MKSQEVPGALAFRPSFSLLSSKNRAGRLASPDLEPSYSLRASIRPFLYSVCRCGLRSTVAIEDEPVTRRVLGRLNPPLRLDERYPHHRLPPSPKRSASAWCRRRLRPRPDLLAPLPRHEAGGCRGGGPPDVSPEAGATSSMTGPGGRRTAPRSFGATAGGRVTSSRTAGGSASGPRVASGVLDRLVRHASRWDARSGVIRRAVRTTSGIRTAERRRAPRPCLCPALSTVMPGLVPGSHADQRHPAAHLLRPRGRGVSRGARTTPS